MCRVLAGRVDLMLASILHLRPNASRQHSLLFQVRNWSEQGSMFDRQGRPKVVGPGAAKDNPSSRSQVEANEIHLRTPHVELRDVESDWTRASRTTTT